MNFLPLVAGLAIAGAVFIVALRLLAKISTDQRRKVIRSLPKYTLNTDGTELPPGEDVKLTTVFYKLGRRLANTKYQKFLQEKLAGAGQFGQSAMTGILYQKGLYLAAGLVFGLMMLVLSPSTGIFYLLVVPVFGFFVPDILVVNTAQKRVTEVDKGLADAIDLLNLCVESGLSFEAAIARVSVGLDGPIAEEFGAMQGEMALGKSRSEALQVTADRTKSPDFLRVISSLQQVDRLGIPITTVLREQAHEMRASRKDKAREQAQKVTIKVLMPLMLCLLPAMFIVVIGPSIVRLIASFSQVGG